MKEECKSIENYLAGNVPAGNDTKIILRELFGYESDNELLSFDISSTLLPGMQLYGEPCMFPGHTIGEFKVDNFTSVGRYKVTKEFKLVKFSLVNSDYYYTMELDHEFGILIMIMTDESRNALLKALGNE